MASGDTNETNDFEECEPTPEYEDTKDFVEHMMITLSESGKTPNTEVSKAIQEKQSEEKKNQSCLDDLVKVANDIDEQFSGEIDKIVESNLDMEATFDNFNNIAQSLFSDGFSIGRIIALIIFVYRWLVRKNMIKSLFKILKYLIRILMLPFIQRRVAELGGWSGVVHTLSINSAVVFGFISIIFAVAAFYYK